jgi:uncharacterized damage-inducible protein DinB
MSDLSEQQTEILARYLAGAGNLEQILSGMDERQLDRSPGENRWSIRQIVHHIVDGDDLWKGFIKQAIGLPGSEFSLAWYWTVPQNEWAAHWKYAGREIKPSLALFRANREHIGQLLESNPGAWGNGLVVHWPQEGPQTVTAGEVVKMQTGHAEHHIAAIREIVRQHVQ